MTASDPIDAFTRRRLLEVSTKWRALKRQHERAMAISWRGSLSLLDAGEVQVLRNAGFLSQRDEAELRSLHPHPESTA